MFNMISVTFDSNVWEQVVDESKRNDSDTYTAIYNHILTNKIEPYFFEGIVTLENIPKDQRKEYIKNFKPSISIQIGNESQIISEGTPAPELSDYLKKTIPQALKMGFKFIRTPRIAGHGIDPSAEYAAKDMRYSLDDRLKRTCEILRFIESQGVGKAKLDKSIASNKGAGMAQKTQNDSSLNNKQYSKNVAEWVDGDALAAHYGYGINYFCTNDRASGAGSNSVFHTSNLDQIKQKYDITVVTPNELLSIIQIT